MGISCSSSLYPFHHNFSPTINIKMSLNPTEAFKTPSDPSQATGYGSIVPPTETAPNTLYAYIQGPTNAYYMPNPAAQIEFFALPGTVQSLAGKNQQATERKAIMMGKRVQNSVQDNLSQWSGDFFRPPSASSQIPCETRFYQAWKNRTLEALQGFAGEHHTGLGEDGTRFKIVRDAEELAELQKGGLQQLSCEFQNPSVQSTRASTNG